ncbi:MAG TPA: NERD domain-containing protein [Bacilli bacterium]|nr:NERD domain-containing protein [Bacilli bacterium]
MFEFGLLEYGLIVAGIVVLVTILVVVILVIRKRHLKKRFQVKYFYPHVYKTALYYDYYLINTFNIALTSQLDLKIDHLLFGNKYIYIINDYIYEGILTGNKQDRSWILKDLKGEESYITNPLKVNDEIRKKLSLKTAIDDATFICITLVNNKTDINNLHVNTKDNYIIDIKDFMKLIEAIESRKVSALNAEQLQKRVIEFDKLNMFKKRKRLWRK